MPRELAIFSQSYDFCRLDKDGNLRQYKAQKNTVKNSCRRVECFGTVNREFNITDTIMKDNMERHTPCEHLVIYIYIYIYMITAIRTIHRAPVASNTRG